MQLRQDRCGDVPVLWTPGPAPLTGALLFGSGVADESFRTAGVSHLVEHLCLDRRPLRGVHEENASVDPHTVRFWATGPADHVEQSLRSMAKGIGRPSTRRQVQETKILAAEGGDAVPPPMAEALARRYGYHGPALAAVTQRLDQLPGAALLEHWRTHLVHGNVLMTFTADPAGLDLASIMGALSSGPSPVHPAPTRSVRVPTPGIVEAFGPTVTCSLDLPADRQPALAVALHVLSARYLHRLRRELHLVYEVEHDARTVRDGRSVGALWVEVAEDGPATRIAGEMVALLQEFACTGPSPDELAHVVAGYEADAADPRSQEHLLTLAAHRLLRTGSVLGVEEQLHALRALTVDAVRDTIAAALPTAMIHSPDPLDPAPTGWSREPDLPCDPPATGRTFRRRALTFAPLSYRVIAGDDAISLLLGSGCATIRWRDVVGVGVVGRASGAHSGSPAHRRSPVSMLSVVGVDGATVDIDVRALRDGATLRGMVEDRVPAHLFFDLEDDLYDR